MMDWFIIKTREMRSDKPGNMRRNRPKNDQDVYDDADESKKFPEKKCVPSTRRALAWFSVILFVVYVSCFIAKQSDPAWARKRPWPPSPLTYLRPNSGLEKALLQLGAGQASQWSQFDKWSVVARNLECSSFLEEVRTPAVSFSIS